MINFCLRYTLPLLLSWTLVGSLFSQTTLTQGDIMVLGVNANATCSPFNFPSGEDVVHLAFLTDIENGTSFHVTDQAYFAGSDTWGTSEGTVHITYEGATTIPAGTVITFRWPDSYEVLSPSAYTDPNLWDFSPTTPIPNGDLEDLNVAVAGDQLHILADGNWNAPNQFDGEAISAYNNKDVWMSGTPNAQNSDLHPDVDPCYYYNTDSDLEPFSSYSGPTSPTTRESWIVRITDHDNWTSWTGMNPCANYEEPIDFLDIVEFELPDELCENEDPISLPTHNIDGTWSGDGVSGNQFDPSGLDGEIELTFTPDDDCIPVEEFVIDVIPLPGFQNVDTEVESCGPYELPDIEADNPLVPNIGYYSEPNGQGTSFPEGFDMGISITLYLFGGEGNCTEEIEIDIEILTAVEIDPINDTVSCGPFTLPPIDGTNVDPTNSSYFDMPNGQGDEYQALDEITVSGTYYAFAGTADCSDEEEFEITIEDPDTPEFTITDEYCEGETPDDLPTTSINGIEGSWTPSAIDTDIIGEEDYVFTPDAGQCAEVYEFSVEVTESEEPEFTINDEYCEGETPDALPTTSDDGIEGSWDPANIDTDAVTTTVYTFTPDAGQCAEDYELSVEVTESEEPEFTIDDVVCEGLITVPLPSTSVNGIEGSWDPNIVDTDNVGTTVYTFTPDAGQCSEVFEVSVEVIESEEPVFTLNDEYCEGETPDVLPMTSDDGITGSWNPSNIDTDAVGTTVYTFTPDAGQCAEDYELSVEVTESVEPEFTIDDEYCEGDTADALPTTSDDGITGSWNPSNIDTDLVGTTTYTFTPDAGQCAEVYEFSVEVTESEEPEFTIGDEYCEGAITVVLPTISDNGIEGIWDPIIIDTDLVGTAIYTFTPDTGQCAEEYELSVEINANPANPDLSVDCSIGVSEGIITVDSPMGSEYEYSLDGGAYQSGNEFTGLDNGNYEVQVLNTDTGCESGITTIEVDCSCADEPEVDLSSLTGEVCGTESIVVENNTFGGSATEVTLSHNGNGTLDPSTSTTSPFDFTYTPDPTDEGTVVTITVTTDNPLGSPCEPAEVTFELTVIAGPQATASNDGPICEDEDINLMSDGGQDYSWEGPFGFTSSEQNPLIQGAGITQSGTYTVTVTDADGCTGTATTEVVVNENPTGSVSNDGPYCEGETIELIATGGTSYDWTGQGGFSSTEDNPTIPNSTVDMSGQYNVVITDDNGCSVSGSTTVEVNESPNAEATSNSPVCIGDEINLFGAGGEDYDWTGPGNFSSTEQNPVLDGVAGAFGTYTLTVTDSVGCTAEASTVVEEGDQPTFSVFSAECAPDFQTYFVNVEVGTDSVVASTGTLTDLGAGDFVIEDVDINDTLIVTIINPDDFCSVEITVIPPDCDCPSIPAPISDGDEEICEGDAFPELSVSTSDPDLQVNWYDASFGGNLLEESSETYQPVEPGVYYTEAIDTSSGCSSGDRTAVELVVHSNPDISIDNVECSADLETYSIEVTTDGDDLSASPGTVTDLGSGVFQVENIPAGEDVLISIENTATGCSSDSLFAGIDCPCPNVDAPISGGDVLICKGDSPAMISAFAGGLQIDWYDSSTGGQLLEEDSEDFLPSEPGTYYAETVDPVNGCASADRTAVSLLEDPEPDYLEIEVECEATLDAYFVNFETDAQNIEISSGILSNVSGDEYIASAVDTAVSLEITLWMEEEDCAISVTVDAPECECPTIAAPSSGGDVTICEGDDFEEVEAFSPDGHSIEWYDSPTGGNLLLEDSETYLPSEAGTWYAEARDPLTDCISDERTAVSLTVNPAPDLDIVLVDCEPGGGFWIVEITTDANLVVPDQGNAVYLGGDVYLIEDLVEGENLFLEVVYNVTGCSVTETIASPDCGCDPIDPPIALSDTDFEICEGEMIPVYETVADSGLIVNWYDSPTDGNILAEDNTQYEPFESDPGTYLFYAEAYDTSNQCASYERTAFSLTIFDLPEADQLIVGCGSDGTTYSVAFFTSTSYIVTATGGDSSEYSQGQWLITNIGIDDTIEVEIYNPETDCGIVFTPDVPDCTCPDIFPLPDTSTCDFLVLPPIEGVNLTGGEAYYDQPDGMGNMFNPGDTLFDSGTYYIFYEDPDCSEEEFFEVEIGTLDLSMSDGHTIVECDPDSSHLFVLADYIEIINEGTGGDVSWYADPDLNFPIQTNVQTQGVTIYAVVDLDGCESDVIPVQLLVGISPGLEDPGPLTACDSIELPPVNSINPYPNEGYYTEENGQGTMLMPGDFVSNSTTLYLFAGDSLCQEEIEVDIIIDSQPQLDSIPDILSCEPVILSEITGSGLHPDSTFYTDQSGAAGNQFQEGDTISESTVLYAWSGTPGCFDEVSFEIVISDAPAIDTFDSPLEACDWAILPDIEGENLSGNQAWYTQTNAMGDTLSPGDTIFTSGTLYAWDALSGADSSCISEMPLEINISDLPDITLTDPDSVCAGDSIQLSATGGEIYLWTGPGGFTDTLANPVLENVNSDQSGVYTVMVTDQAGCSATDSVEVFVDPIPAFDLQSVVCGPDNQDYNIIFNTDADSSEIGHSAGDLSVLQPGEFEISDIPAGTAVQISLAFEGSDCDFEIAIDSPNCDCDLIEAPVAGDDQFICEGDAIPFLTAEADSGLVVDWYDAQTGGNLLAAGTNEFTPTDAGTYYAEAVDTATNCVSDNRTPVSLTVDPVPNIEIDEIVCGIGFYFILLSTDADTVFYSEGIADTTGVGWIPIGEPVLITGEFTETGCTAALEVASPDCDCPDIPAPVTGDDQSICEGDAIPFLTAEADSGLVVDWYDAQSGGSLLASGTNEFTPMEAGTYYAEAVDTATNCVSEDRSPVSLTINAVPEIEVDSVFCDSEDFYVVMLTTDADSISSSLGSPTLIGVDVIPIGEQVIITGFFAGTGCFTEIEVASPNCDCQEIPAPVTGDDQFICEGDAIPFLTAEADSGLVVDWYDAQSGGNLLAAGTNEFTPTEAGTYYAEAVDTATNCISENRTPISLTINAVPEIEVDSVFCDTDDFYVVLLTTDADSISSSLGVSTPGGVDSIPVGEQVIITGFFAGTGCFTEFEIASPDCDCPDIPAPVSLGDTLVCEGEALPPLSVMVEEGHQVNWYDEAVGGNLLLENDSIFTPPGEGTYYAEAYDPDSDCNSTTRTPVTLTVQPLPQAVILVTDCEDDEDFYFVTFSLDENIFWIISVGEITENPDGSITSGEIPFTNETVELTLFGPGGCINEFIIEAPDCDCPEIEPPVSLGDVDMCDVPTGIPDLEVEVPDGIVVNWYGSATGSDTLLTNSTTFEAPEEGSYYAEAVDTLTGCVSENRTAVVLSISLPSVLTSSFECDEGGQTYSFTFETDGHFLIFAPGDSVLNPDGSITIENIPIDQGLGLGILDTNSLCEQIFNFDPPVCDCPEFDPPVSAGDTTICEGDEIPELMVMVDSGFTVNWYDTIDSQTPLASNTNVFTPAEVGIYYAETVDTLTGCVSEARTAVEISVNPRPRLPLLQPGCINDEFYFVVIRTNADQVMVNAGNVELAGGDTIRIMDIPVTEDLVILLTLDATGCQREFTVEAPNCECPFIPAPVSAGDLDFCEGESIPEMVVTVDAGLIVNWYDQPEDGTLLVGNSPNFIPAMAGTYYAEAVDPESGCTSDERTAVVITENPSPVFALLSVECTDEEFYELHFTSDGDDFTFNAGTSEQIATDTFRIHSIPSGTDLIIEVSLGPCSIEEVIESPECDCPPLELPADSVRLEFCQGDSIPAADIDLPENVVIQWFSSPVNQDLIAESDGVFTAPGPGFYYGEVLDTVTGCRSEDRLVLSVIMLPLPSVDLLAWDCESDMGISAYFTHNATEVEVVGADFELLGEDSLVVFNIAPGGEFTINLVHGECTSEETFVEDQCDEFCNPTAVFSTVDPPCPEVENGVIEITEVTAFEFPIELSIDGDFVDFIDTIPYQLTQLPTGSYNIGLLSGDCELEQVVVLSAAEPTVEIIVDPVQFVRGSVVTLSVNTNIDPFEVIWIPEELTDCENCTEIEYEINATTEVMVTVTDSLGCSASASATLIPIELRGVYVPDAFSPNDDGVNDVFRPYFPGDFDGILLSFEIYDRWGNRVFAAYDRAITEPDSAPGWDGTFNGREMNPAVFVFQMEVQHEDGYVEIIQGDVVLLR